MVFVHMLNGEYIAKCATVTAAKGSRIHSHRDNIGKDILPFTELQLVDNIDANR